MTNKNYLFRPEASPKAAPVRKKDIQESLQEASDTADKLLERMTEMNRKYSILMDSGITSRLDNRSVALFNTGLAETKAMPREVGKAVEKAAQPAPLCPLPFVLGAVFQRKPFRCTVF